MAYDPYSSYEPPRRAYYGQERQQAPVPHQDYNGGGHNQYDDYHQPQQSYNQGYGNDYGYQNAHENYGYEEDNRGYGDGGERYDSGYGGDFNKQPQRREPPPQRGYDQPYQRQPPPRGPGPRGAYDNPRQKPRPPPERHQQPQPYGQSRDGWGGEERSGRRPAPPGPPPPNHAQPPRGASRPREPKMTMEEWKAQERSKMNAAPCPDVLAQDNAFPTFPNSQPTSRPENNSSLSHRSNDDYNRSSISSSRQPPMNRGNSYEQQTAPGWSRHNSDPAADYHNQHNQHNSYDQGSRYQERSRNAPPQSHDDRAASQPRFSASEYAQDYAAEVHNPYETPYVRRPEPPRPKTANASRPVPKPIDTGLDSPHPGYMNHNPISPAIVPPRPSTAQGSRARAPQSPYAAKPYAPQHDPADRHSLDDVLADYGAISPPEPTPQSLRRAMTRDEEIESEMPDFDSAAPNQSKGLHNRPPPSAQRAAPPPASFANDRPYKRPGDPSRSEPQRARGTPGPANGYEGFDFGVPQQAQQDGHMDMPQPPRAPYATEPPARRSMDDTRQMPYHPGPQRGPLPNWPGQRMPPPMGAPGRGPVPPHMMRPDIDRSQSAGPMQPSSTGYGQMRAATAPPPRPDSEGMNYASRTGSLPGTTAGPPLNGRSSHGDALPHHPVPIRPGLMEQGAPQPSRPPPVRNYDQVPSSQPPPARAPPPDEPTKPVTQAELGQLRSAVDANPNSPRQALTLVKKLAEASVVLASEGGRADAKMTAKNRERYASEAYKRLKKLVASGYPDAMFYMADCFGSGELGLEPDPKEAFTLYQSAAKAGHAAAAFRTAVCCEIGPEEGGGTRKDYPKAVQWYRRAATLGDVAGMYKIGAILLKGLLGQEKHLGEAVNWLKRSAERADAENPHALHELGLLYDSNNSSPEVRNKIIADDHYARELFEKAARFGFKASQFRMGQAYEYGSLGLPIDNRASIAWYSKAAAQGEHQAELALSGWYLTGAEGILQQSDTEAYLWARKAAASEPPLAKAMFAMGYFSEQGIGCPSNLDEARRWYGRAASYKFPKALERLEELKNAKAGKGRPPPAGGKLTRKDQKRDEAECVVM